MSRETGQVTSGPPANPGADSVIPQSSNLGDRSGLMRDQVSASAGDAWLSPMAGWMARSDSPLEDDTTGGRRHCGPSSPLDDRSRSQGARPGLYPVPRLPLHTGYFPLDTPLPCWRVSRFFCKIVINLTPFEPPGLYSTERVSFGRNHED